MAVIGTYCEICGLPVQLDHYVDNPAGGLWIWREGAGYCEPAIAFGPGHAWLSRAVALCSDRALATLPMAGTVHDGYLYLGTPVTMTAATVRASASSPAPTAGAPCIRRAGGLPGNRTTGSRWRTCPRRRAWRGTSSSCSNSRRLSAMATSGCSPTRTPIPLTAGSAGSESWTCYAPAQAGSDEAGRMGKRGSRRDHHGGGNGGQRAQPA